jgi:hypothetical protein
MWEIFKGGIMRKETETDSLKEVAEMAAQSLNPVEYQKFCEVHDILVSRRSIPLELLNIGPEEIDK